MSILETVNLSYSYDGRRKILRDLSVSFEAGKIYAILGPSGCGKTTLLSLLGGLDAPNAGSVLFDGTDIRKKGLACHRKHHVSFIFQAYNLIDYLTPAENVALVSNLPPLPLLARVGLTGEEARRNIRTLSGGQQQRTAIARALAAEAPVILADEPTGNLDEENALAVMELLTETARRLQNCVILVTHSGQLARRADVIYRLKKGTLLPEKNGRPGETRENG